MSKTFRVDLEQPPASGGSASANGSNGAAQPDSLGTRLFRQAQQGDRGAFGQFVRLYQDRLFNAMLRLVGNHDDALELTQETLTRALANLQTYRGESAPYTWLFRIAMNLGMTSLRNKKPTASLDGEGAIASRSIPNPGEPPDAAAEREERVRQVLAAMDRLDVDHRIVLVMRDIEGFDYQQMAEVLNLQLNTLKSRLFRARMALREELSTYMES